MPVPNYSVLKGSPISGRVVTGHGAHYHIGVRVPSGIYTAAVNIESSDGSDVLYAVRSGFVPPNAGALVALPAGVQPLASEPGGLALDFVRSSVGGAPLVSRAAMSFLPAAGSAGVRGQDTGNAVVDLLDRAVAGGSTVVYLFGSSYEDYGEVDGIHDIHMNQGNPAAGGHQRDNGAWQDGAAFVTFPNTGEWTALFLAFQTQSWATDGQGNPL